MNVRSIALPVVALALIGGLLGFQVANGGGSFEPISAQDPCVPRHVQPVAEGLEGLGEHLVLLGLDGAACRLGTTRETLLLDLATDDDLTDAQVEAVRGGLRDAVDRLADEGELPKVSDLAGDVIDASELSGLVKAGLRAIPDRLIDNWLKTDKVLHRAIEDLDIAAVLNHLSDPSELIALVQDAITQSAIDEVLDGLPIPFS